MHGLLLTSMLALFLWGYGDAHVEHLSIKTERLRRTFKRVRFVAYGPTKYNPLPNQKQPASRETIRKDLQVLRPYFDGLVTYSCSPGEGLDQVVPVAASLHYKAVILGIWDITSEEEVATAIRLTQEYPALVVALIVGNEGILFRRYDFSTLKHALARLRAALPEVALSTSEPISEYGDPDLLDITDFHAPNIHPWFAGEERRQNVRAAVDYVKERVKALRSISDEPILVHETGLPSGPLPYATPECQSQFWKTLLSELPNTEEQNIVFFEAFDAGEWKNQTNPSDIPVETHWGAFTNDREPKAVVSILPRVQYPDCGNDVE